MNEVVLNARNLNPFLPLTHSISCLNKNRRVISQSDCNDSLRVHTQHSIALNNLQFQYSQLLLLSGLYGHTVSVIRLQRLLIEFFSAQASLVYCKPLSKYRPSDTTSTFSPILEVSFLS